MGELHILVTCQHETVGIEAIQFAVDFTESFCDCFISPDIANAALGILCPHALDQYIVFIKGVDIAIDSHICAANGLEVFAEVVVLVINQHPAGKQFAKSCVAQAVIGFDQTGVLGLTCADTVFAKVIVEAFNLLQTGQLCAVFIVRIVYPADQRNTVNIGNTLINAVEQLAAVFLGTLAYTVNQFIGMAGSLLLGTPVNNRVADFTVGSAGVAVCGTGCGLVFHSGGFRMDMHTVLTLLTEGNIALNIRAFSGIIAVGSVSVMLRDNIQRCGRKGCGSAIGIRYRRSFHCHFHTHQAGTVGLPHNIRRGDHSAFIGRCTVGNQACVNKLGHQVTGGRPDTNRNRHKGSFTGCFCFIGFGHGDGRGIGSGVHAVIQRKAICHFRALKLPLVQGIQVNDHGNRIDLFNVIRNHIIVIDRSRQRLSHIGTARKIDIAVCGIDHDSLGYKSGISGLILNFKAERMGAVCQGKITDIDHTALITVIGRGRQRNAVYIYLCCSGIQSGIVAVHVFSSVGLNCDYIFRIDLTVHCSFAVQSVDNSHLGELGDLTVFGSIGIINGQIIHIDAVLVENVEIGFIGVGHVNGESRYGAADGCGGSSNVVPAFIADIGIIFDVVFIAADIKFQIVDIGYRQIHPHTKGGRAGQVDCGEGIFDRLIAGSCGCTKVGNDLKGILAVSDLSGRCIHKLQIVRLKAAVGQIALSRSCIRGFCGPAIDITVFEVFRNHGSLAKSNRCRIGLCFVIDAFNSDGTAGNFGVIIAGGIIRAVNGAHSRIAQFKYQVRIL